MTTDSSAPSTASAPPTPSTALTLLAATTTWKGDGAPDTLTFTAPRVLLSGPTGSGKSRWVEAVLLALTGAVDGVVGRDDVAAPARLWRGKAKGAATLVAEVVDSAGRTWRYTQTAARSVGVRVVLDADGVLLPPEAQPRIVVSREIREILRSGGQKASRWLADALDVGPDRVWDAAAEALAGSDVPAEDHGAILDLVTAALRRLDDDNDYANVIETLSRAASSAAGAAKVAEGRAAARAEATLPPPTDREVAEAEAAVVAAQAAAVQAQQLDDAAEVLREAAEAVEAAANEEEVGGLDGLDDLDGLAADVAAAHSLVTILNRIPLRAASGRLPCPCCDRPTEIRVFRESAYSLAVWANTTEAQIAGVIHRRATRAEAADAFDAFVALGGDADSLLRGSYAPIGERAQRVLAAARDRVAVLHDRRIGGQAPALDADLAEDAATRARVAGSAVKRLRDAVHAVVTTRIEAIVAEAQAHVPVGFGALYLDVGKRSVDYGLSPVAGGSRRVGRSKRRSSP